MQESFDLFAKVRDEGNQHELESFLDSKTLTIFLNKYDIFLFKVARHGKKILDHFYDFEDFYYEKYEMLLLNNNNNNNNTNTSNNGNNANNNEQNSKRNEKHTNITSNFSNFKAFRYESNIQALFA